MTQRWPDPADTTLDRSRAIATAYRAALLEEAPARCAVLDNAARELREHWIAPLPETVAEGELVTTAYAAQRLGVAEQTIRNWGNTAHVPVTRHLGGPGAAVWDLDELRAYQASQRRRRGHR